MNHQEQPKFEGLALIEPLLREVIGALSPILEKLTNIEKRMAAIEYKIAEMGKKDKA